MLQGYADVLRNRQFGRLWVGQLASALGDSVRYLALLSLVYSMRGSTTDVGMALMVTGVATLVAAPVTGTAADRYSRRRIMALSAVTRVILVVLMGAARTLPQVFLILFLLGISQQFFSPALNAFVPSILQKQLLVSANGLLALTFKGVSMLGPAIGGLMVAHWGHASAFHASALAYLILTLCTLSMREPAGQIGLASSASCSVLGEYRESILFIWATPLVYFVVLQAIVASLAGGAIDVLTVKFADTILRAGAAGLGMILSAKSAGFVLGLAVLELLRRRLPRRILLPGALVLVGVNIVAFGLNSWYALALVLSLVDGMGNTAANILSRVVLQDSVPDHLLGKVAATNYVLFSLAGLVSAGLGGIMAEHIGLRPVFVFCGLLVGGFGLYGQRALRTQVEASRAESMRSAR
jgi:MFS family permease